MGGVLPLRGAAGKGSGARAEMMAGPSMKGKAESSEEEAAAAAAVVVVEGVG
jgi:hypothetical protein